MITMGMGNRGRETNRGSEPTVDYTTDCVQAAKDELHETVHGATTSPASGGSPHASHSVHGPSAADRSQRRTPNVIADGIKRLVRRLRSG